MLISLDSVLGRPESWHFALAAPTLLIPLALAFLATAPDSPRSLLMAGRREDALASLEFYQVPHICGPLKYMRSLQSIANNHTVINYR